MQDLPVSAPALLIISAEPSTGSARREDVDDDVDEAGDDDAGDKEAQATSRSPKF